MTERLPPLNSLKALESAARQLSFKRAAEELNVTPAAISHQIKALEDYLGVPLFRRVGRGLELTAAAKAALPRLSEGFDVLSDAVARMVPLVDKDGLIHRSNIRLSDYAKHLDGLVLQGGADIAPESYGETALNPEWAGDRVRDVYEMELLHEFVEAGKPVLGICRGAQMINVAFGGTLYQDINSLVPDTFAHRNAGTYDKNYHGITIEPDSGLARLYPGKSGGEVNSIHHQSVKTLGRDLVVEAWSEADRMKSMNVRDWLSTFVNCPCARLFRVSCS